MATTTKIILLTTALVALFSAAISVPFEPMTAEASPMAQPDPMATMDEPRLYLVPAGRAPFGGKPVKMLPTYAESTVCPATYGSAGFSVRCDLPAAAAASYTGPVIFRVDGDEEQRERRAPYLLNGDKAGKIYRYKGLDEAADVRVVCKVKGYKSVWVDLVRKC